MAVDVARGVGAAVGFVTRRMDDLRPGCAGAFVVRIDVGEIDEDTLRRR
jgi:hypothetical protein